MLCQAYFSVSSAAPADYLVSSGAFLKYRAEHGYIRLHIICIRFSYFLSHSYPERANRFTVCRQTYIIFENGCLALLAMLVLHRAKLLASNQSVLALGVAPHSAPARTPGVYAQRLCTMQSQPSIHSLSRGKGVFGKDAEIRTHRALHEAKPTECPKGDRDLG